MMFTTACTFIFSVLTCYTFYRFLIQQDTFLKDLSLLHFNWQIFFLTSTLMVIITANLVTSEVNISITTANLRFLSIVNRFEFHSGEKNIIHPA